MQTGYEKYCAESRGRPSQALEMLHAEGRPITTGEFAKAFNVGVVDMGKRLKVLERKGFITRIDKSTVVGASWRFTTESDIPEKKERVSFLGSDALSAMRQAASKVEKRIK